MLTLSKQFAVTIQNTKPFRNLRVLNLAEHQYLIMRRQRVTEVTSSGKTRKLLVSRKECKILASGVSDCSTLIAGLVSTGQILICSKMKKVFQSFQLPPQIKLSIEMLKPEQCSLYIFEKGLVLIFPNDQVWFWRSDDNLKDATNLSPHLKGTWLNLNSANLLKGHSEVNSWRSNISESRPGSNSSRPAVLKSRFTTHAYSIKVSQDFARGRTIGVLRVWLRSINEDSCVLESRYLTASLIEHDKCASKSSWVSSAEESIFKGQLEFWSKRGHKDMGLVAKLDHSSSIAVIGVNSSHPYFCQLVFLNPITGVCTTRKLCNYVTVEDIPVTSDGKTSFWIDDLVWAPDDGFVAVAFKSGFLSVFSRLGEPIAFVMNIIKIGTEPRIFSHVFFSTDPELIKLNGGFMSVDWTKNEISLSDGYTICEFSLSNLPSVSEMIPICIPTEVEVQDISINISHETNPIPSEMDSGPKRRNIELALQLLRNCLSNCHANDYKDIIFAITSWIDNVLPPQIHEEINYTALPNSRFETEARLSNNLVLKKKMHAIDVYTNFTQILSMENWSMIHSSESKEWIMSIAYQVFKYMLADQQALYAWNVLTIFERWTGLRLQRIRNMLIIYCLIQYRNHQANHINVVYYLIAYAAVRGKTNFYMPIITEEEADFIRLFIKQNLDIAPSTSQPADLSCFYYLNQKIKEKIDLPLNYLLGYSNNFNDISKELCAQLIRGNLKYADSYMNSESLMIFGYYFDPTEPLFISPIEVGGVFQEKSETVYDLLAKLKRLSQVKVQKEKKFQKDSVFLYWTLRIYSKLEFLLPPDTAFYAINKLLPALDDDECMKAAQILKRLFESENYLKLIELSHPSLRQLFQQYALFLIRNKLKTLVTSKNFYQENSSATSENICNSVYTEFSSVEVSEIIAVFVNCIGTAEIINDKTENWINLEQSNFSHTDIQVLKVIQDILRYLWYIHVQDQLEQTSFIEWRIRMLSFPEIQEKNEILDLVLSDNREFSTESGTIISLYLRNFMFNNTLQSKFQNWKQKLMSTSDCTQILHSLDQPGYANPWFFDKDFLEFSNKIITLSVNYQSNSDHVIKSWNSSVKSLSKQYKVNGFLKYSNGFYSEAKDKELYIPQLLSIFIDPIGSNTSQIEEIKKEIPLICPISVHKKRLLLEFSDDCTVASKILSINSQISCKNVMHILKLSLREVFSLFKVNKKRKDLHIPKLKNSEKEKFSLFTVKHGSSPNVANQEKILPLKFIPMIETQHKQMGHRRIQSVMIAPVVVQKPFQLIRVQKSYV